jgi:hypothetical protein
MSQWDDQMDRLLVLGNQIYGKTTSYQRPGFPAFSLVGVPDFLDRLENVNQGQFYSIFYRIADFDEATFSASVTATFSGPPASGGTITFDGITYTAQQTLDNAIPFQFWRAGNALAAATNLAAAINQTNGFSGTGYSSATTPHPTCAAVATETDDGAVVVVSYKAAGFAGNLIAASESLSFVSLSSKVFSGGGPIENDLVTVKGTLYRVSDVPEPDSEGGIQIRLEKKKL